MCAANDVASGAAMNSAYVFYAEVRSNSATLEAVVIFTSAQVSSSVIDSALTEALQSGRITPDLVLFIAPETHTCTLVKALEEPTLAERFNRLRRAKGVVVCGFTGEGTVPDPRWIRPPTANLDLAQIVTNAREAGLRHLAARDGVVTLAPPGAYFRNPSQAPRSYFIRAGLMCRNSVESAFVAYSLLPVVKNATAFYNAAPNIIWVDTVGIAHIAYALSALGERLHAFENAPEVRSFSSYGGHKDIAPGTDDRPIVLISASTSGALAREVVAFNKGVPATAVTTILGSFDCAYPELICLLSADQYGPVIQSTATLREIQVAGEDFLFRPGEPLAVELRRTQLPRDFRRDFRRLQGKRLIHCFKRVSADRRPKPLIFDANSLVNDDDFQLWLKAKAIGSLPSSIARLVYQQDEPSRRMAELVRDALAPFLQDRTPEITSVEELEQLPPQPTATVAVIAAVAGSGMELMRATKALRTYQPQGARHFIIGVLFARTYAQLTQLQSNLSMSADPLTYAVTKWCEFAASPDALSQFRQREMNWLRDCAVSIRNDDAAADLEKFARDRLTKISAEGLIRRDHDNIDDQFVSLSDTPSALDLSDGFALWEGTYRPRCLSDVLFTVACWLQNARENKLLKPTERLDEGGFQQSVIAPDCFLRFTDPVLQCALLRVARDSELDYRSSLPLSARASEILRKFFSLKEEASVEFVMALAFGRMRLRTEDLEQVSDAAMAAFPNDARVLDLSKRIRLKYLERAAKMQDVATDEVAHPTTTYPGPTTSMLTSMLRLQDEINKKVNPKWLDAGYPYLRAVFVESVEALDHHGWKWWKKSTSDKDQVRIELIDIWHFVLSHYLISAHGVVPAAATQIAQDWQVPRFVQVDATRYDTTTLDVPQLLELLGALSALRRPVLPALVPLFKACSLHADDLFRAYVSKNVLNHFRQDHGYADGTYKKEWDGREDNIHLADIMETLSVADDRLASELYEQLKRRYALCGEAGT
jgi:dimeric dUTPase (all-alpha-NTP-PPase superfamily)